MNLTRTGGIDVWLAYYGDWEDDAAQPRLHALLSDEEKAQRDRFYFADDRLRYLVTRAMVRTVLSRYAAIAPVDWRFTTNDYGRPAIADSHTAARGLEFNIPHTRGLIALGVAWRRMLGVDVESLLRPAAQGLSRRMFSEMEHADLQRVAPHQHDFRFYEYWTFKESYIKARGMGLSLPLDKFQFSFPDPTRVRLDIATELTDDPACWHLWQFQPRNDYLLALCAQRLDNTPPRVRLQQLVSLADTKKLPLPPRKCSINVSD